MKELELLTLLTNVKSEYILQAQALRSGEKKAGIRKLSRKRALLIAAVISLLLLLVGCAAVLISLQKANLGHIEFSDALWMNGTPFEMDVLSLNGYVESPQYCAIQEWLEYENSYDTDKVLLQKADADRYMPPPDYGSYCCYTAEMCDKVDEICQKYGLSLAGPTYFPYSAKEALEAVSVPSIANPLFEEQLSLYAPSFYLSGSFRIEGDLEYRFENRTNTDSIPFVYMCSKTDVFFTTYITTDDINSFDSWEYTAWDGTELLLAQNRDRGMILADNGDYFISVVLYFTLGETVDVNNQGLRKDMEEIANSFAYEIHPQAPTESLLQYPNTVVSQLDSYDTFDNYFARWMPGSLGSEAYSPDYQQKFVDLDGDGMNEMLIWNVRTGVVYEVVTQANGLYALYGYGNYADDADLRPLYLCAGNILEKDCGSLQGKQQYEYYRMQNSQFVLVETIMESNDGKFYWSESGGASSMMWAEITEAEYHAVREKYMRISVPQTFSPIDEAYAQDVDEILLKVIQNQEFFFSWSYGNSLTLSEYCQQESERMGFPVEITRYAFVDLDSDGVREAVVDFRFGENSQVMCMVLKFESHNAAVSGTEFYIRQMNEIKEDGSFYSSNGWSRLRFNQTNSQWETVLAEDGSSKTEIQWTPYS